jgi:hypothetical protein
MHPKAHEILVNFERNKRAEISLQLAVLAIRFDDSLERELALPPPDEPGVYHVDGTI